MAATHQPGAAGTDCCGGAAPCAPCTMARQGGPRQAVIITLFCHSGRVEDGVKGLLHNSSHQQLYGDVLQRRSYTSQQSLLDATQPKGRRILLEVRIPSSIRQEFARESVEHAGRIVSPHSAVILFPIDGALNRLRQATPRSKPRCRRVINFTAAWETADDDKLNIEWARAAWRDIRRFSTGGTYVNFLTEEEGDVRIQAAYPR